MDRQPLISIIIPTFNRRAFIGATLDSILAQTYTNWECIVIDDGSTDETEALVMEYALKDVRISYVKRPDALPKGANACRNYGFELSKGDYINWFDSDDMMMPEKLELQLKSLQTGKEAPFCVCQSLWFDKEKNISLGLRAKAISSENRFEDYILQNIFWLTTAPLWRRHFIVENNLKFDDSLHQSQEYDFHIRALYIKDNYTIVENPLVQLIMHKDSVSSNIYDNAIKVDSNVKVKLRVLKNYSHRLSIKARFKIVEMLTLMYKDILILKDFYLAKTLLKAQLEALGYLECSQQQKWLFNLKLRCAYVSYRIFGKGYGLVKPLVN